jgi:hypothetical protein
MIIHEGHEDAQSKDCMFELVGVKKKGVREL